MRILLAEDDSMIGEEVSRALRRESYAVDWVQDGKSAAESILLQNYDLILLDLGLPQEDGISVLRKIRQSSNTVPVIIVTARDSIDERVQGLDLGADDYMVKPFEMSELLARIRAVSRRKSGSPHPLLSSGLLTLDPKTRVATYNGVSETLSSKEYALLRTLLHSPGVIFSRSELEDALYGWNEEVESNAVEFLIHSIRRKLGKESIINIRGAGWMVAKEL